MFVNFLEYTRVLSFLLLSIVICYLINKIVTIIFDVMFFNQLVDIKTCSKIKTVLRLLLIITELLFILSLIKINSITNSNNVAIIIFVVTYLAKDMLTSIQAFILVYLNERIEIGDYICCNYYNITCSGIVVDMTLTNIVVSSEFGENVICLLPNYHVITSFVYIKKSRNIRNVMNDINGEDEIDKGQIKNKNFIISDLKNILRNNDKNDVYQLNVVN